MANNSWNMSRIYLTTGKNQVVMAHGHDEIKETSLTCSSHRACTGAKRRTGKGKGDRMTKLSILAFLVTCTPIIHEPAWWSCRSVTRIANEPKEFDMGFQPNWVVINKTANTHSSRCETQDNSPAANSNIIKGLEVLIWFVIYELLKIRACACGRACRCGSSAQHGDALQHQECRIILPNLSFLISTVCKWQALGSVLVCRMQAHMLSHVIFMCAYWQSSVFMMYWCKTFHICCMRPSMSQPSHGVMNLKMLEVSRSVDLIGGSTHFGKPRPKSQPLEVWRDMHVLWKDSNLCSDTHGIHYT